MLVKDVFSLLQKKQFQVAIVLDEFGGTTGMVTLEDILEEVFGDLHDEFDTENPLFQILPGNQVLIRGDMLIEQVIRLGD
jgi:CBS domain containing-hemolysin-like protein